MAAELFRARYAEKPFVSLFLTGSAGEERLHAFTNCDRIRLARDGASLTELENAFHHVVDLGGGFTEIIAEGDRGGTTVVERLKMWDEASTIAIAITNEHALPGHTAAVDLTICDVRGTPVRDWNGHVTIELEGDGLHLPYTATGEVVIARGEGRTYLKIGKSGGEIVIHATGDGLEPSSKSFRPGDS